ncbi:MAG: hypothetical protein D6754_09710 [Alphaproteobacteria bacterium]|nr:MAG: hypothetical protein D6754_09710 [Alphaproteobacteria bacterium]
MPSDAQKRGFRVAAPGEIAIRVRDMATTRWYERRGIAFRVQEFPWIGWRGVFTTDPDGNTVEPVAATGKGPQPR